MKTKLFTSLSVMGTLGLLATSPVQALGLGKINLSSALDEPFKAEIPVTAITAEEAESLQVRLASSEEFERAGLVKEGVLTKLKFTVIQKAGKTVIAVSSKQPVKEPLLDFLLTAKTDSGQLIREYTVLLDPPKHVYKQLTKASKPKVVASPSISQPTTVRSEPIRQVQSAPTRPSAPSLAGSTQYGPTSRTDTLWDIALKTRPNRDVSVHQMMLAIVDNNQSAFIKQNINGLKSGYTLDIPSNSQIQRLSRQQAITAVQQQNVAWKNRNKPSTSQVAEDKAKTTVVATAPKTIETVEQDVESVQTDTAKPTGEAELKSRLQLLGSSEENLLEENELTAFGSDKVKALSDQLTLAQEVIESQQQENIDIKARMAAMEEQIQTLRKLIALQDPDLARLQSKLEQEAAAGDTTALTELANELEVTLKETRAEVELAEGETAASAVEADLQQQEEMLSTETDEQAVVPDSEALSEAEVAPVEEADEVVAAENGETTPQVIEPEASPSLLTRIQHFFSENKLMSLGGALLALLGLLFVARKRNESEEKVSWDQAVGKMEPPAEPVAPVVAPVMASEPEPEPEQEPVKIVEDLIKDADVYISYADFDKAAVVLEAAYEEAPSNLTVIQKLLFSYYKQRNTGAFVEMARQYTVERDSMEWAEVSEWGRSLDADNEMFAEPMVEESIADEALQELEAGLVFDGEKIEPEPEINVETDAVDVADSSDELLDFEVSDAADAATETDEVSLESDDGLSLTSDIDTDDSLALETTDADLSIEGLDTISEQELAEATQALSEDTDGNDLDFDLSDLDQVDEAETKLDLAAAYVEMSDPEGAKSILEEIMQEGDEDQKSRAQALLNDLT